MVVVSFDAAFERDAVLLLELDEHLLNELGYDAKGNRLAEAGSASGSGSVQMRGPADEETHLCTRTRTYIVKEAVVSNTLLVLSKQSSADNDNSGGSSNNMDVDGEALYAKANLGSYLEVTQVTPKFDGLHRLLRECLYAGPEQEAMRSTSDHGRTYSTSDLRQLVSASDTELLQALHTAEAVELDGAWRLLKFEYQNEVMEAAIEVCKNHHWTFLALPEGGFLRSMAKLESFPPEVTRHCLRLWSDEPPRDGGNGELWWRLSEVKVCRFLAINILQLGKKLNMREFMETWIALCPPEFQPLVREELLRGVALKVVLPAGNEAFEYFPRSSLPNEPRERFERLFEKQAKWTSDELWPYLGDIARDDKQRDALLLKHTRVSTLTDKQGNAVTVYTKRF